MSLKMYIWSVHPKFFAVAQANSVAEARALLLQNDNIGESGDGSCVERDAAREHVLSVNPSIWHGPNAEFALTSSAELREQEAYSGELFAQIKSLRAELATATARIATLEAERDGYLETLESIGRVVWRATDEPFKFSSTQTFEDVMEALAERGVK